MTARLSYWYLTHPRWGRPALVAVVLQGLSVVAGCAAPRAGASTNTVILNFTGLKDSYGVPIGDYFLAIASVRDQITQAGPGLNWNPGTWMSWTAHTLETLLSSVAVATVLTFEAGAFVGIAAVALWIMKITVSTYWLTVIGELARAICGAVVQVTSRIGLLVLAVPIGVLCGVATIRRGEAGRGWTMILIALTLPALSLAVFADPADEMYGPDGLLAFGRRIGFSVAEAATNNGSLGGPGGAPVDALTASLITHTVREPLQLWNFGHVVDRVGGCGAAWSAAVRAGVPDGPITAMAGCGDRSAVAYAQHLDASNAWIGLIFVAAAGLLAMFMIASGWAVLKVSVKAIWTTVIVLPTLWLGAIPGAPQRRAVDVVWQFFRHGIEVMVCIVYVSVIGLAVERIVANPLPAELGGTSAFAHVLMLGAVSIVALVLLRHIRADLAGLPRGHRGMYGRAADVAVGLGMHAALGGVGSAAVSGVKGPRRFRAGRGAAPWEQLDRAADNAAQVHGGPQPGVDPVPNGPGEPGAESGGATADSAASAASDVGPIVEQLAFGRASTAASQSGGGRQPQHSAEPAASSGDAAALNDSAASSTAAGREQPAQVAPITDWTPALGDPLQAEPAPEDSPPPSEDDRPGPAQPMSVEPTAE